MCSVIHWIILWRLYQTGDASQSKDKTVKKLQRHLEDLRDSDFNRLNSDISAWDLS